MENVPTLEQAIPIQTQTSTFLQDPSPASIATPEIPAHELSTSTGADTSNFPEITSSPGTNTQEIPSSKPEALLNEEIAQQNTQNTTCLVEMESTQSKENVSQQEPVQPQTCVPEQSTAEISLQTSDNKDNNNKLESVAKTPETTTEPEPHACVQDSVKEPVNLQTNSTPENLLNSTSQSNTLEQKHCDSTQVLASTQSVSSPEIVCAAPASEVLTQASNDTVSTQNTSAQQPTVKTDEPFLTVQQKIEAQQVSTSASTSDPNIYNIDLKKQENVQDTSEPQSLPQRTNTVMQENKADTSDLQTTNSKNVDDSSNSHVVHEIVGQPQSVSSPSSIATKKDGLAKEPLAEVKRPVTEKTSNTSKPVVPKLNLGASSSKTPPPTKIATPKVGTTPRSSTTGTTPRRTSTPNASTVTPRSAAKPVTGSTTPMKKTPSHTENATSVTTPTKVATSPTKPSNLTPRRTYPALTPKSAPTTPTKSSTPIKTSSTKPSTPAKAPTPSTPAKTPVKAPSTPTATPPRILLLKGQPGSRSPAVSTPRPGGRPAVTSSTSTRQTGGSRAILSGDTQEVKSAQKLTQVLLLEIRISNIFF